MIGQLTAVFFRFICACTAVPPLTRAPIALPCFPPLVLESITWLPISAKRERRRSEFRTEVRKVIIAGIEPFVTNTKTF